MAGKGVENKPIQIARTVLTAKPIDSKAYYASASLAFSILFMGLLVGFFVYNEKSLGTIERIQLSRAGVSRMFTAKILTGVTVFVSFLSGKKASFRAEAQKEAVTA